jgi:hypothetical protein
MELLEMGGDAILVYESLGNYCAFSAIKALAHVLRLSGSNVHPCLGRIPKPFVLVCKDLYSRKVEEVWSRQNKKKSMTCSIDNIQERTSCAMLVVSVSVCLAESASTKSRGVLVYV